LLEPSFEAIAILFVSLVTGGYGLGNFFGKLLAWLLGKDRALWGDVFGIVGGLAGVSMFISLVIAIVSA
jgi:hypothetical protein